MIGVALLIFPLLFLVIAIIYLSIILYKLKNSAINHVQKATFPVDMFSCVADEVKQKNLALINRGMENGQDVINIIYRSYMKEHVQAEILLYNIRIISEDSRQVPQPGIVTKSSVLVENKERHVEPTKPIWVLKNKEEFLCVRNLFLN